MKPDDAHSAGAARVRFDKWLWAARFYKTRSLAAQAIDAGQAEIRRRRPQGQRGVGRFRRTTLTQCGDGCEEGQQRSAHGGPS